MLTSDKPTSPSPRGQSGARVPVLYVRRKEAHKVRKILESQSALAKDFRLTPSSNEAFPDAIALPWTSTEIFPELQDVVLGAGVQFCPYSTALLGNHQKREPTLTTGQPSSFPITLVQRALFLALSLSQERIQGEELVRSILRLDSKSCPKRLEVLGDDRTLVLPRTALAIASPGDSSSNSLDAWLTAMGLSSAAQRVEVAQQLWKQLAMVHESPRVVRRGAVCAESETRQSNYEILWPPPPPKEAPDSSVVPVGSDRRAWITVTEQGIRQSFDLTKVMFSRGNVTEKIRFGRLVQPGEIVLDLYAGIGYFTLPALVYGKAAYLYACEWNPDAVHALQQNLVDNDVADRATVYHGDCRQLAKQHGLVGMFDRVSLGLLPSSQGGWKTAVQALRPSTGGWLHVHGNVPVREVAVWTRWLGARLWGFVGTLPQEQAAGNNNNSSKLDDWIVVVSHVEKVKSFAPTVAHFVADVFVGPAEACPLNLLPRGQRLEGSTVGMINPSTREWETIDVDAVTVPSCALSAEGPLHQSWMMELVDDDD